MVQIVFHSKEQENDFYNQQKKLPFKCIYRLIKIKSGLNRNFT